MGTFEKTSSVSQALAGFVPDSEEQRSSLEKIRALLETGESAFQRAHFEPGHFTASGFVLSPSGRELLLISHRKLKMWLQPGGHFESEDLDLISAARREIEEETGLSELELLEPVFDVDVHQIPALGDQPPHLHHDLRVLFRCASDEVKGGDEEARWFPLEELVVHEGPLADGLSTDESVRRVARSLLKLRE